MDIMIIGASRGLGRALGEGLCNAGDTLTGVSRSRPAHLTAARGATVHWIEADLSQPQAAATRIDAQAPPVLDVLVCNLGIWEAQAFSDGYDFLASPDEELTRLVDTNITALLLLLRRLLPRLLRSRQPRLILTGSTSALRRSGRPEVAFGATKAALEGIADALREQFRAQRLAVTTLHLGYLNTDDGLQVPREVAAARGAGTQVPLHDVVAVLRSLLSLSDAAFVRELVMPAIADPHF